jgi:hypothetical protein
LNQQISASLIPPFSAMVPLRTGFSNFSDAPVIIAFQSVLPGRSAAKSPLPGGGKTAAENLLYNRINVT